jgi:hypothetical protein
MIDKKLDSFIEDTEDILDTVPRNRKKYQEV